METILIVHNYYQVTGGEDTVVANEKKMLEENGHKVVLYTRDNSELKNMGVGRKLLLPFTTIYNPRTARDIKKIIKEENIDIVHVHNTLNLISPAVYYAALKMGRPVVQTIHNFRLLCPGATFYRDGHICEDCVSKGLGCALKHKCYRGSFLQTLICVISTKIHRLAGIYGKINYICLTNFTKNKLVELKQIDSDKVFVKPNVVFDYQGRMNHDDYFLFVGRIEKIKGIELLIDAFKQMPDIRLKIVGSGVLDKDVNNRISAENLDNIMLLGFKNHDEINELMKNARALIMCSQWYETFGMVIAEAYSNGIPVLVGNIGNIKEMVIDNETGFLFEYDDVDSLVECVNKMIKADSQIMGENGYKLYKDKFSPEVNYRKLEHIYSVIG